MQGVLIPESWKKIPRLLAGFGDRRTPRPQRAVSVRQVHGARVVAVDRYCPGHYEQIEADALTVTRAGVVASVRTADCVPILLVEPVAQWAAAVHAGWRGTLAGVVREAIAAAARAGCRVDRLEAALGPAIGPCCYEIGNDVARRFEAAGFPVLRATGRLRLDLKEINRRVLLEAGLRADAIHQCGPCTSCRCDRYWSFRAQGGRCGRQWSWIGWASRCSETDHSASL